MNRTPATPLRALRDLTLLAATSIGAAALWAAGPQPEAYLLDAELWQDEVGTGAPGRWPADGWVRLLDSAQTVEVRAVKPGERPEPGAEGALYLRLPGMTLPAGLRSKYRYSAAIAQPRLGKQYELSFGSTRFSLSVESGAKGMRYDIGYGGETYSYQFGPYDASETRIRAVVDLDGDRRPDFLIDVADQTYLLLSTQARPGFNPPTADLWAKGC
jgi:hypothetical protein